MYYIKQLQSTSKNTVSLGSALMTSTVVFATLKKRVPHSHVHQLTVYLQYGIPPPYPTPVPFVYLLLWEPKHGARKRGRPALTYVDQLQNDTGLSIAELKNIMENRKEWMKLVNGVRVRSK